MKRLFILMLILVLVPFSLRAQTMRMTPDSGYQGEQLPVTIVGIGTQFSSSGNVSEIIVKLERSGTVYDQSDGHLANDSTIDVTFALGATMLGSYDLEADIINGGSEQTFNQDSAFTVLIASPSILSVTPPSAHDSQSVILQIAGLNTNFESGTTPTILFQHNGRTYFTSQIDTVHSTTSIGGSVIIPPVSVAPEGVYDVIIQNGTYSDTGKQKFTVLGPLPPPPGITFTPDSGAPSTSFDVTIVGEGTDFLPSGNVSYSEPTNISLSQNGVTFYQTTADTVFSTTLAHAIFNLPDNIAPGIYDANVYYSGTSYNWQTTFHVTSTTNIQISAGYSISANPSDTVTIGIAGTGVNFIYDGSQVVNSVTLVNGTYVISAQTISVTNDTFLSAFFAIPSGAPTGSYDVQVVEPGTGTVVTGKGEFTVEAPLGVTENTSFPDIINAIQVFPNPASDVTSISFTMAAPSPLQLLIYDALGRTVATLCDRELGTGMQKFEWPSDDAPDGSYFYEIIAGDDRYGGRIVVQH